MHKAEAHPFKFKLKIACFAGTKSEANARLEAVAKAFYHFNKQDYNELILSNKTSSPFFLDQYRKRILENGKLLSVNEIINYSVSVMTTINMDHITTFSLFVLYFYKDIYLLMSTESKSE